MEVVKRILIVGLAIFFSSCFCKKVDFECVEYAFIKQIIEAKYKPDSVLIETKNHFAWDLNPPCGFKGIMIFIENGTTDVIDFKNYNFPSEYIQENYTFIQKELRIETEDLFKEIESGLENCEFDFISISFVLGPEIYIKSYNFQSIFWEDY